MASERKPDFKESEIGLIPLDWTEAPLGELGELKNGVNFGRDDFGEGLPIINVTNLFDGRYASITNLAQIKKNAVSNYRKFLVRKGDILFARSSLVHSGAGQAAIVDKLPKEETVFSGFIIRFRKKDDAPINNEFLNYLVRSKIYRDFIPQILAGTAITNINQSILSRLPIVFPSIPEQEAIVRTVSDLDSKIELNQNMNKVLEDCGAAVFRQWFVNFEFPNWENKPYRSSGGEMVFCEDFNKKIPKNWSIKNLSEISNNLDSKRVPLPSREREKMKGSYPYYGAAGILDNVNDYILMVHIP
jgi:type I restriction enzyme S subunit